MNPTYKEFDQVYQSDTCIPLLSAWQHGELKFEAWARANYPCTHKISNKVLPGLSSIGYWNSHSKQSWGLDWHRNEGIEICFLETGKMPFELENGEFVLNPDELLITRPWQVHKLGNPNIGIGKLHWLILDVNVRYPHQDWEWPSWIILNQEDKVELTNLLRYNELPKWKGDPEIRRCFEKIGGLLDDFESHRNESWVAICINELLMKCLEFFRKGQLPQNEELTQASRTVEIFIDELQDNYAELWTLESMAGHCGLGTTRFIHYFKQLVNMTPLQYLNVVRLEAAAKQIIANPRSSITTICYDCGYSSSQYFSTSFRKKFGCSPVTYQKHAHKFPVTPS